MLSEEEKKAIENIKAIVMPSENVKVEKVTMYKECIEDIIRIINLIKKQSNEIEKEKKYNEFYIDLCNDQQKEIQHLKEYKNMYKNLCK